MTTTVPVTGRRTGSSLTTSALAAVVLFVASLLVGLVFGGRAYASPFVDDGDIQAFFAGHATMLGFMAFFQFAASIALAVFTATLWARLRVLAPESATATNVAAIGGIVGAAFLALNALVLWVLTHASVIARPEVRRGLHYLFFGLGGFAHVAGVGLLVAGASFAALRAGLLPRWFVAASLVSAAVSGLSTLTFLSEAATTLIPVGRFTTLVWTVAIALYLRRERSA